MKINYKYIFLLILVFALFQNIMGQVKSYTSIYEVSSLSPINSENLLGHEQQLNVTAYLDPFNLLGSAIETKGTGFEIGFNFIFNGINYDRFGVISNGWIVLGKSQLGNSAVDVQNISTSPLNEIGPENKFLRSRIAACAGLLYRNGLNSRINYQLSGEEGEKVLTVQWQNFVIANSNNGQTSIDFQILLYEKDNSIEIKYGDFFSFGYTSSTNFQIGLGGFELSDFINKKTTLNNWNNLIDANNSFDNCLINQNTILPEYGRTLRFTPPSCIALPSFNLLEKTTTTLELNWTPITNQQNLGYQYKLDLSTSVPQGGLLYTMDTAIYFSGLIPNTDYYFHIRSKCSETEFSTFKTEKFRTNCTSVSLPYNEDFENVPVQNIPDCSEVFNNNDQSSTWQVTEQSAASGTKSLGLLYDYPHVVNDWFILPPFSLEKDSTYILNFDFFTSNNDSILIGLGRSPQVASFIIIDTMHNVLGNYAYEQKEINFEPSQSGIYFISIKGFNYDNYIDNLHFNKYECASPLNFNVSKNIIGEVNVKWLTNSTNDNFEYSISTENVYPPSNILTAVGDSLKLIGLDQSKKYFLYMRKVCDGNSKSTWSLFSFTTKSNIDECVDAAIILAEEEEDCTSGYTFSTIGASSSNYAVANCGGIADDDVWLKFEAKSRSHKILISNNCVNGGGGGSTRSSSVDPSCQKLIAEFYKGECVDSLIFCIEVNEGASQFVSYTQFNTDSTYTIRLFNKDAHIEGQEFSVCISSFATTDNDICANAIQITPDNNCTLIPSANLAGTLKSTTPSSTCGPQHFYDVWYKFEASATSHLIETSFSNGVDGVFEIFSGDCNAMTSLDCVNNSILDKETKLIHGLVVGQTYFIRAYDFIGTGSDCNVAICIKTPVVNDDCANAINIAVVSGITHNGALEGNTNNASGQDMCNGNFADDDIWYMFTASNSRHLISVIPAGNMPQIFQPTIELLTGDCSSTTLSCSSIGDLLVENLIAGHVYYFKIYSKQNYIGKGNFRVGISIPPNNINCNLSQVISTNVSTECTNISTGTLIGAGSKNEVWFKFKATSNGYVINTTEYPINGNNYSLYKNCNLAPVAFDNSTGRIVYKNFQIDSFYFLKVSSPIYSFNNYQFFQNNFDICIMPIQENDNVEGAITLQNSFDCNNSIIGSNIAASRSNNSDYCNIEGKDVWYKFVANKTSYSIKISGFNGGISPKGQLFDDSLKSIICFEQTIGNPYALGLASNLIIGNTYYIRVSVGDASNTNGGIGGFTLCLNDEPLNNYCQNAEPIYVYSLVACTQNVFGTTINANGINPNGSSTSNVWYVFKADHDDYTIRVNPLTAGFDPGIRVWKRSLGGGSNDQFCVGGFAKDDAEYYHGDFVSELSRGDFYEEDAYYLVEIYKAYGSLNDGDFELCVTHSSFSDDVFDVIYSSSNLDTTALKGEWSQTITKTTLQMTGKAFDTKSMKISFVNDGNIDMAYVKAARLYQDSVALPSGVELFQNAVPYGIPGNSFFPQRITQFGAEILSPSDTMVFEDVFSNFYFKKGIYNRNIYLVFDIACDAPNQGFLKAKPILLTYDNHDFIPKPYNYKGIPIFDSIIYETKQSGLWHQNSTWLCNEIPPNNANLNKIRINHDVALAQNALCGDIEIRYTKSLMVNPNVVLTIGGTSNGNASGLSNKLLNASQGSLYLNYATLNLNGSLFSGNSSEEPHGNGVCCDDGAGLYELKYGSNLVASGGDFVAMESSYFCISEGQLSSFNDMTISPYALSANKSIDSTKLKSEYNIFAFNKSKSNLNLNQSNIQKILKEKNNSLNIMIPFDDRVELNLVLEKVKEISLSPRTATASGSISINIGKSIHYRGFIKGKKNSKVAISIYDNNIFGLLIFDNKQYSLGQLTSNNEYRLSEANEVIKNQPFKCSTMDDSSIKYDSDVLLNRTYLQSRDANDCIRVFMEIDHDIFLEKGSSSAAIIYLTALFNQVAMLYETEGINLMLSEVYVWDVTSPYNESSGIAMLEKFGQIRNTFNGDVGMLVSYKLNEGIAYLNGLCKPNQKYSMGYSKIFPTFSSVPNFSLSVMVLAHEFGHLFGSRHTHACAWNGDNTAIDGCAEPEGNCIQPELPTNGGTIMSYCHLTSAGVNLSLGFGIQPGNAIRNYIASAKCLQSCPADTFCNDNLFRLKIKTDQYPNETTWSIKNNINQILYSGGPYTKTHSIYDKSFCLPDGCYQFDIYDSRDFSKTSPALVINNSTINFDPNDGNKSGEFRMSNSRMFTKNAKINVLDPSEIKYNVTNVKPMHFHGTIKTGGGDDTIPNSNPQSFDIRLIGPSSGGNTGILVLDSFIVGGGYGSRKSYCSQSFLPVKNMVVLPQSEYEGGLAISENLINNGLITGIQNRNLSFCGEVNIGHHFSNITTAQTLSGNGFFRTNKSKPIPTLQTNNYIDMLRVDNSYSGLNLQMPLGVLNTLRLVKGNIAIGDASMLTLGDETTGGIISTDITNTQWWSENPFEGNVSDYDGGHIVGPFKRYMHGIPTGQKKILPIGDSMQHHSVELNFSNNVNGFVIGTFKSSKPSAYGLPLFNEQNVNIAEVSPSGFWNLETNGLNQNYSMSVNASNFKIDNQSPISNLSNIRLIKRPTNGSWALSNSTTNTGPSSLSNVAANGLMGFSDFAIGIGTGACSKFVYNKNDQGNGSLRHAIDSCSSVGDVVYVSSYIDTISLTSDTLKLNKGITIKSLNENSSVINNSTSNSTFRINPNVNATLENLILKTGYGTLGRAIYNKGNLTLKKITIYDSISNGSSIYNKGILNIEKELIMKK